MRTHLIGAERRRRFYLPNAGTHCALFRLQRTAPQSHLRYWPYSDRTFYPISAWRLAEYRRCRHAFLQNSIFQISSRRHISLPGFFCASPCVIIIFDESGRKARGALQLEKPRAAECGSARRNCTFTADGVPSDISRNSQIAAGQKRNILCEHRHFVAKIPESRRRASFLCKRAVPRYYISGLKRGRAAGVVFI